MGSLSGNWTDGLVHPDTFKKIKANRCVMILKSICGLFIKVSCLGNPAIQCKYANLKRPGDITLGDFWGIGTHGIPFKQSQRYGISLVLSNYR